MQVLIKKNILKFKKIYKPYVLNYLKTVADRNS